MEGRADEREAKTRQANGRLLPLRVFPVACLSFGSRVWREETSSLGCWVASSFWEDVGQSSTEMGCCRAPLLKENQLVRGAVPGAGRLLLGSPVGLGGGQGCLAGQGDPGGTRRVWAPSPAVLRGFGHPGTGWRGGVQANSIHFLIV